MGGQQRYVGAIEILDERNANIGGTGVGWTLLGDERAGGVVGVGCCGAYGIQLIVGSGGAVMGGAQSSQRQHAKVRRNRSGEKIAAVQTSLAVSHDMNVPGAELRRFRRNERC